MGMGSDRGLSAVGEVVRQHDPDRYFTALFAPAARREALFVLYAFNHELARARESVRQPMAALIRLQWWREVVEGQRTREAVGGHAVAGAVRAALEAGWLEAEVLEGMIAAREAEADAIETEAAFEAYVRGAAGGVMVAAARALGMAEAEALRDWGAAYGVAGVLRNVPAHARQERCLLPLDLVAAAGLSEGAVLARPDDPALSPVRTQLREMGARWAAARVAVPREAVAAALPVVWARRDLAREELGGARPMRDRLAVVAAGVRGRV